uniref:Secretory carrier-associated membrane protein n=1 Tax=Plectus sambesii TaxID=2011161 RepID=A0A914VW66_9BILA
MRSDAPPPYTHQSTGGGVSNDELFRRQEELEKKAQELRRREEELERRQRSGGAPGSMPNNWPPVPAFIPVQPCFYQDIEVEIPVQFQRTVTLVYYVWLVYILALVVNVVASLLYMLFASGGVGVFILAVIQLVLLSPCSFLFWFRPVYKAFRNDSSVNFMVFFFAMAAQILISVLFVIGVWTVGITKLSPAFNNGGVIIGIFVAVATVVMVIAAGGQLGWISAFEAFPVSVFAGLIMLVSAIVFTAAFLGMVVSLIKVHRLYRGTGASFAKAQQEFSQGVMSDRGVQHAAGAATAAAAGYTVNQATGGRF